MANNIYKVDVNAYVFGSEAGDDVAWSTENIADGAGRQSAFLDLGVGTTARPRRFMWRFWTQLQATPTVGNVIYVYLKTSDGSHPDNDDGTGDAAVSAEDKLKNLDLIGILVVDEAAADVEMVAHGEIEINERYAGVVLWNASGATITNDAAETKLSLTEVPDQIQ